MDTPVLDPSLRRAAENIVREVGQPPSNNIFIICSREKYPMAEQISEVLDDQGIESHILLLGTRLSATLDQLRRWVEVIAGSWGLIVLLHPQHSSFLFKAIGRPDLGVRIPEKYLFCDWLINLPSLVRIYDIDWNHTLEYRQMLLSRLSGAREVKVSSAGGTEIVLRPRTWHGTSGEIYTAPVERFTQGRIFVDGCAYGGPPENPFVLQIENGKVTNLKDLNREDRQQKWVQTDLTRDENSHVLAEFGIGINPGAQRTSDLMEAEQALGTCHFGFGNNLAYGGMNASGYHFDLVILDPTIEVDGVIIIRDGLAS